MCTVACACANHEATIHKLFFEGHRVCLLHAYLVNVEAYVDNADAYVVNEDITQYASSKASHRRSISSIRHASRPVYARA